jgi:hypothetical protein
MYLDRKGGFYFACIVIIAVAASLYELWKWLW